MSPPIARRIGWPACFTLVFVSAFFLSGTRPSPLELDPSWHVVLEYATAHHWQFGTQIISTYGPLGFLAAPYSLGHLVGARIAFAFFWGAIMALTATGLARRLTGWVRYAVLAWLMFLTLSEGLDQGVFWVLACGALILLLEDPRQRWLAPVYGFAFIVFSLIKVSFLTAGFASLVVVVVCWIGRRKFVRATVLALGAPAGFVAGWMALGQSPSHLAPWIRYSLELEAGYSGAMSLAPKTPVLCAALAALALFAGALIATILHAPRGSLRWAAVIILAEYGFWAWKEGLTRSGNWHTFVFLWFLPLGLAFFFLNGLSIPPPFHRRGLEVTFAAGMALCLGAAHFQLPGFAWQQVADWPRRVTHNAEMILAVVRGRSAGLYADARDSRNVRMLMLDHAKDLIGNQSVDVMNYLALAAVANEMNYRPRPVFQGNQTYTPALQIRNEGYFQSEDRPHFVMLCQQATDGRFPTLEDSAAFNYVLNNYVPVGQDGPFLILQQRTKEVPTFQLVHDETLRFGDTMDLRPWANAPLFMAISIVPSLLGRAATFLYQQEALYLRLERDGAPERYRIVPSMAAQPFLVNPLLDRTSDVLGLYLSLRRPHTNSVVLEHPSHGSFEFQDRLRVQLYTAPGFLRAARGFSPSAILADVQGRVFLSPPRFMQNSIATRVVMFHGSPAWLMGAPSKIGLEIPPNTFAFSGYFGVPGELFSSDSQRERVDVAIEVCPKTGACRRVFEQLLPPPSGNGDGERFSFRIPIDNAHDRYIELTTAAAPSVGSPNSLSVWSRCRFEESPVP
jgi:hypothetical protein